MSESKNISVPLLDLKSQFSAIREPVMRAIERVCESQYFVMGPEVKELEERIAKYSECRFGIGVSSGTDALLVALMALEIGSGDAVITTPYTFFATGGTIARVGARPLFCDIDSESYNLSAERIKEFVEKECDERKGSLVHVASGTRVRAIMPVHLYGQTAEMDAILELAGEYALPVIEDAAQSIGSEYANGGRAGSLGAIGCFSFFPSKNLGAFGDGGMCTTNDPELADRLSVLRLHGGKPKYYHAVIGGNFRLDSIQAAVLLVKLEYLDAWTSARQANASKYDKAFAENGLDEFVKTPMTTSGQRHIYNQYVIRASRRDDLRQHLSDRGIGTEIYYPVPLHLQKCFSSLGYGEGSCPESEAAANETIAIPVYPELSNEQLEYVVTQIKSFYS